MNSLINGVAANYLTIKDRAIHYGDGVFETILCHNRRLFYWQQHYQRLLASANKLLITCPHEQTLLDDIARLLATYQYSDSATFVLKIIVTRGISERGYVFERNITSNHTAFTEKIMSNRLVLLSTIGSNYSSLLTEALSTGELFVCKQQASINESLAGLKHLNRLENVLARNEWHADTDNKFADGLMFNARQYAIEGSMSNIFAIKNNRLFTPDLSQSGVNGIMRDIIISLAKTNKIHLSIVNIKLEQLLTMDALFITNSLIGMKSISKLATSQYHENVLLNRIFNMLLASRDEYVQTV